MTRKLQNDIELVFKENYREFCLLSYSYVGCMDQAQDIVQDVFVKLLLKDKSFHILNVKSYVWKSVKNSSLKHIARAKKTESLESDKIVLVEEHGAKNEELNSKLRKAMDKLPPKCKVVFEMCVVDGLKYNSAADSLGISENTVKTQMKKAYKILRHNLTDVYLLLIYFMSFTASILLF